MANFWEIGFEEGDSQYWQGACDGLISGVVEEAHEEHDMSINEDALPIMERILAFNPDKQKDNADYLIDIYQLKKLPWVFDDGELRYRVTEGGTPGNRTIYLIEEGHTLPKELNEC
jgi:hypothetical protein